MCSYMQAENMATNQENLESISENLRKWFIKLLKENVGVEGMVQMIDELACEEIRKLICYLLKKGTKRSVSIAYNIAKVSLVTDLMCQRNCCITELLQILCYIMRDWSLELVTSTMGEILGTLATSCLYFYLCAKIVYDQFGIQFLPFYVKLFIHGFTVDLNHLEAARNNEDDSELERIELRLTNMYDKLSTFCGNNKLLQRECLLSAFSLRPTKERLALLQSLTLSILSSGEFEAQWKREHGIKRHKGNDGSKTSNKMKFFHPLLTKGIENIPRTLIEDLTIVLEAVRSNIFRFNYFDVKGTMTELNDYFILNSKKLKKRRMQIANQDDAHRVDNIKNDFMIPGVSTSYPTAVEMKATDDKEVK